MWSQSVRAPMGAVCREKEILAGPNAVYADDAAAMLR